MQAIYTRTMRVKDDMLGKAMEIGKGLAKVRKKYYPKHQIYFSFQIGGDPRTVRETVIGTMFEDDNFEADQKMSADKKYQNLQKQLKKVTVEGTWAFFNLIFVQNICVLLVNTYSLKIDKTGVKNDSNEAIIAPLVFTILSAVLIFGLSDKIYI